MILDTNALSAFADGVPPVVQQIAAAEELHIPVIVLEKNTASASRPPSPA